MTTTAGRKTKLTCSFSYYRSKGTTSLPRRWRRDTVHRREFLRSLANWKKKHNLCLFLYTSYYHIYTTSQPKGTTSPQPILIDDNGTPATWTLVLFQQVIDRQDRTRAEGRFSFYWNHWRYSLNRNTPTTTGQGLVATTTCLVGYTPLRLQTLQDTQERDTSHDTSQETDFASHLVFASHLDIQDYSHQDYRTSRTTNHRGH